MPIIKVSNQFVISLSSELVKSKGTLFTMVREAALSRMRNAMDC